jgi:hypothetical protein
MLFFFFSKIGEQEGRKGTAWGFGISERGEKVRKGHGKMNIV